MGSSVLMLMCCLQYAAGACCHTASSSTKIQLIGTARPGMLAPLFSDVQKACVSVLATTLFESTTRGFSSNRRHQLDEAAPSK
jgi:hypothetical protein